MQRSELACREAEKSGNRAAITPGTAAARDGDSTETTKMRGVVIIIEVKNEQEIAGES